MLRYAEFCTGIGGFRKGIEKSKLNAICVYKNEKSLECEKTYQYNFRESFDSHDIFDISEKTIPDIDMLCAGFPCQSFSIAGKQKGFNDSRGTVFFKLESIIKEKMPRIVFLENVPNLKTHDNGKTFSIIKKSFENIGYNFFYYILNSAYFGIPQKRPRLFIVALRKDIAVNHFCFTKDNGKRAVLKDILIRDNHINMDTNVSDKWQTYIDLYTGKIDINDIDFELPKTRIRLERKSENANLKDCIFQIRSSGIRAYSLDEQYPTFAVSVSGGGAMIPVLSKQRRHLSVNEIKLLMGFPKDYDFPSNVSKTNQIKQLSNAVCPPVIESIANDIYNSIFYYS
ncbi:DNA cytosine methyltransferase [Helicobacter pylori]